MKKGLSLLLVFVCVTAISFAQTKRIALRSHSGRLNSSAEKGGNWGVLPEFPSDENIQRAQAYRKKQDSILFENYRKKLVADSVKLRKYRQQQSKIPISK